VPDEMFTLTQVRCCLDIRTTALQHNQTPRTFTAITMSHSSAFVDQDVDPAIGVQCWATIARTLSSLAQSTRPLAPTSARDLLRGLREVRHPLRRPRRQRYILQAAMPRILLVRQDGDPVLRQKAKKVSRVDDSLRRLIDDMFYTIYSNETRGVGLAAPQVGVSLRVIVVDMQDEEHEPIALINPEIVKASKEMVVAAEGCLSVPGLRGDVERHEWIAVKGRDEHSHEKRFRAEAWFARCIQHEIDHLDGILYTDKATDVRRTDEEEDSTETAAGFARGEKEPVSI